MQAGSLVVKKGRDIFIVNSFYSVECESKTQQGLRNYNAGNISYKDKCLKNIVEMRYCDRRRGKLRKNQIHCQRRRATESGWLWSKTCWRVSIQPDERNSWKNMGSQAEAKVSSGGIARPLLQKKGKAWRREKAKNYQHLWKAGKNICRQNLYELKTGSSRLEMNSKGFLPPMKCLVTSTHDKTKRGNRKMVTCLCVLRAQTLFHRIDTATFCGRSYAATLKSVGIEDRSSRQYDKLSICWKWWFCCYILSTHDWPRPLVLSLIPQKKQITVSCKLER